MSDFVKYMDTKTSRSYRGVGGRSTNWEDSAKAIFFFSWFIWFPLMFVNLELSKWVAIILNIPGVILGVIGFFRSIFV